MPKCLDCLTENVTVKVTDPYGFGHWFCAEDWAAQCDLSVKISAMLAEAAEIAKATA